MGTFNPESTEGLPQMLLRHIERFLRQTDMPTTTFGRLAARDPRFVFDLRKGRIPREDTALRVEAFMAGYRTDAREECHVR